MLELIEINKYDDCIRYKFKLNGNTIERSKRSAIKLIINTHSRFRNCYVKNGKVRLKKGSRPVKRYRSYFNRFDTDESTRDEQDVILESLRLTSIANLTNAASWLLRRFL